MSEQITTLEQQVEARREVEQMNAVLKYDWLALCGLRESYIIAIQVLTKIAGGSFDVAWCHLHARQALRSMVEPLPENVKYIGSFAWALAMMKAGRMVVRHGCYPLHISGGLVLTEFTDFPKLSVEDYDATDWQLAPVDAEDEQ